MAFQPKTSGPTTHHHLPLYTSSSKFNHQSKKPKRTRDKTTTMGGGGGEHGHHVDGSHADFRTKVWSMSGGPYCRPKHWKRNTAIAMFGIFLVCIPIAMKSAELERRPHEPVRPIPSQLWCKNFGNKEY